jgi:hypothetical protein
MQLSSSDWQLASSLPRLLQTALQQPVAGLAPEQQAQLSAALQQHEQALAPFKRMLRFDQATLTQLATPDQVHLQLDHASHDGLSAPSVSLSLHTTPSGVRLQLGPNALTHTTEPLALHLDTQGWRNPELAALNDTQRLRINALVAVLPLALMDAVANGADKDSLSPWGKLAPQLRACSQLSHTPAPPAPAKAPAKPKAAAPAPTPAPAPEPSKPTKTSSKTAKTTSKTAAPQAKAPPADTQHTTAKSRKAAV